MTVVRYHGALVALHWLLGFMILLGLFMGTFKVETLPNADPAKIDALRGHIINGTAVGILMILRAVLRALTQRPPEATTGIAWADATRLLTHLALYVLVFVMVFSGVAMALSADLPNIVFLGSGQPLPASFDGLWMRVVHGVAAKLLMALIVLHVGAALWHHFVRHDGLLHRMGFGPRR
jgi:cytochrome b561